MPTRATESVKDTKNPQTADASQQPTTMSDAELDAATKPGAKPGVPSVDLSDVLGDLPTMPDDEEIDHAAMDPVTLSAQAEAKFQTDSQMVTIRVRRNLVRAKIGDTWYTLKKGEERDVPRWVADWLTEQGYL